MNFGFPPRYTGFLSQGFRQLKDSEHAPTIKVMLHNVLQQMDGLVQPNVFPDRRRDSRAQEYARAWAKVNANFVPRNRLESQLHKIGLQIEKSYRAVLSHSATMEKSGEKTE